MSLSRRYDPLNQVAAQVSIQQTEINTLGQTMSQRSCQLRVSLGELHLIRTSRFTRAFAPADTLPGSTCTAQTTANSGRVKAGAMPFLILDVARTLYHKSFALERRTIQGLSRPVLCIGVANPSGAIGKADALLDLPRVSGTLLSGSLNAGVGGSVTSWGSTRQPAPTNFDGLVSRSFSNLDLCCYSNQHHALSTYRRNCLVARAAGTSVVISP